MSAETRPSDLTAHDLLKTLAIVLTVADHVGYHFMPDVLWLRVLGRLCVPIWFFLIGYAGTRAVPKSWWIAGGAVLASALAAGQYVFPLPILFTLALCRLKIDEIAARALRTLETFAGMFFLLFLLSFHSSAIMEYGTLGVLFAIFGAIRRRRDEIKIRPLILGGYMAAVTLAYMAHQILLMPTLGIAGLAGFLSGMAAVMGLLTLFRPAVFPRMSKGLWIMRPVLKFTGRHTLAIYAAHLIAFRVAATVLFPERFPVFDFQIMPASLAWMFAP